MIKKILTVWVTALLLSPVALFAQEDTNAESLPQGMERLKVGRGSEVIVPEGTKSHKVGDLVVLEKPEEYVARRMSELEGRLSDIETREKELSLRLQRLEAQVADMRKPSLKSVEKEEK